MQENNNLDSPKGCSGGTLWSALFLGIVALMVIGSLLPTLSPPRSHIQRINCQSNLRNIVIATLNYEAINKSFPLPVSFSENGTARSWRVELLPQLEQQALRDEYHDDQPWNGPNNLKIAKTELPVLRCPAASQPSGDSETFKTSYVLITGPGTVFPGDMTVTFQDIQDGSSNTIIMLEINDSDIAWTEPRDLTIDEAIALFNRSDEIRNKHPTNHKGGRHVAFADGHIEFAPEDTPPETLRALFTIDDGIAVSLDDVR